MLSTTSKPTLVMFCGRVTISGFAGVEAQPAGRDILRPKVRRSSSIRQLIFDPDFLLCRNHCCAPDALPNVSVEQLFQIRNDAVANAISKRRQIFVRLVFAILQPCARTKYVDFTAPDSEKWPTISKFDISDFGALQHRESPPRPLVPEPRKRLIRNVSTTSSA